MQEPPTATATAERWCSRILYDGDAMRALLELGDTTVAKIRGGWSLLVTVARVS